MLKLFQIFQKSESGATLVEYGVALILAIIVGGAGLSTLANETSQNMGTAKGVLDCADSKTCGDDAS